jgi:hypothetical protein
MKTSNLRVNQLSEAGYKWYLEYLDALDAKNVERYGLFLAEGCQLVMNNAEPVVGKESVLAGLSYYWRSFGNLEHELLNIYGTDLSFMLEALNHYQRLDGKAVTLRAVALTDRNESGKATSVRLYTDTGPLFAQDAAQPER